LVESQLCIPFHKSYHLLHPQMQLLFATLSTTPSAQVATLPTTLRSWLKAHRNDIAYFLLQ
jgi:hypothetical protein